MKTAIARLESMSAYSQSRFYDVPKLEREIQRDYEDRTWRERCWANKDGYIFIPPMAFKNCLSDAARYLSMKIPGGGKATYTKHIEAGVMVTSELVLPIKKDEVDSELLFVPSDGRRGGGKRVVKCFPIIHQWSGEVTFRIFDEIITENVLHDHLVMAGEIIGIGRFRPRNNGYYGKFAVKELLMC